LYGPGYVPYPRDSGFLQETGNSTGIRVAMRFLLA
jgi:hypothetical protein